MGENEKESVPIRRQKVKKSKPEWEDLFEEASVKMRRWRVKYPRATFNEIETTVDEEMARVRARMLEDLIHESASTEWRGREKAERPKCPVCGTALSSNGQGKREWVTEHEQVIELRRSHGRCPKCKATVFPPG
jgi:hypothetical protein